MIQTNPYSLINNKIQAICEDSRGVFWIGTAGDGLHTMNRATGEFERHLYDPAQPEKLSRSPVKNASGGYDHITFITEDALGNMWIGTLGNGINYYDPKTGKMIHYTNQNTSSGFTDNSGWSFCISRDGILWIGTFQGGLFSIDPYHKTIPHISVGHSVGSFMDEAMNSLWIGTDEGLILQNKATGTSKKFVHDRNPTSISDDNIRSMFRDREGILWIGTGNGLNRFNTQSNDFTRYQNDPKEINSISPGSIWVIEDGGGDSLWIGTSNGLDLMNKRTGKFTHLRNNPKDTNSLSGNEVISLARDKSGNLWVGTFPFGGLNYFDRKTGTFKHFLKGRSIGSLHLNTHGILWVGTNGDGVYTANNSGADFIKFTRPGNAIGYAAVNSILEDDQKNIWISALNTGVFKINPHTSQSALFDDKNGINTGNLNFKAGYVSKDGEDLFW